MGAVVFAPERKKYRTRNVLTIRRRMRTLQLAAERRIRPKTSRWMNLTQQEVVKGINKQMAKDEAANITESLANWQAIETGGVLLIKPVILDTIGRTADEVYAIIEFETAFDLLTPNAVELADTITADMVTEITEETKDAISLAIRDGVQSGKSIPQIADSIKPRIGLTERQMIASANREEWLLINKPNWSQATIDRSIAAYDRRQLNYRYSMIARTETSRTIGEATILAYEQTGVVDMLLWVAADHTEDDTCSNRNGRTFTFAESRGMLPAHPN